MAAKRSPQRDKAFKLWRDSGKTIPLKNIATKLDVSESLVRKWKCLDKWEDEYILFVTNKKSNVTQRGAPMGNKNSIGHGAPKGNKNAVTTGAYENIWMDCLTDEEKELYESIKTDIIIQLDDEIRLITLRERRMMERIQTRMRGLSEKERRVLQELQTLKVPVEVYDEKSASTKVIIVPETKMVVSQVTEVEYRAIDDIMKIEEALTRIQDKKDKMLMNKHKLAYELEKLNLEREALKHRKEMDRKNNW